MARSLSPAHDDVGDDDFDPSSQLAILRRAVAEIVLPGKLLPERLATTRAELRRFCSLAEVVLELVGEDEHATRANDLAARMARRLPNRALLASVRGELYDGLVDASRGLLVRDRASRDTGGALSMRALLSDFHGALLPDTDDANVWALTVAAAELSLLLLEPALALGPAVEYGKLCALGARTERWSTSGRSAKGASPLYAEVRASIELLDGLSQYPEVRRHDERVLKELSQLLGRGTHDITLAVVAADRLSALRGRDRELDRSIADLPLDPEANLGRIARRVRKLCVASLAS
jgi:hypothetical protein